MLRIASILVLLGLLRDVHPVSAADWNPAPSMPEGRYGASAAPQGDRLLVLGGSTGLVTTSVLAWDGSAWSTAAPLIEPRQISS